ncbi:DUF4230 domain-containing protein [Aneurinibacillus sp. BA2021]|nr:DUF4230 domain-containing protein [Aneurinibacillus sp. BA2021]
MNNKDDMLRVREAEQGHKGATIYRLPYADTEQAPPKRPRFSFPWMRWTKKTRKWVMACVLGLAVIGAGIWAGSGWLEGPQVTGQTVVQEIRDLSYLTTAEAVMMTTLEGEDAYRFYNFELPGTKRFFHIDVPAKVLVGIDLKKVSPSDISIDESSKQITVTLPRADFLQDPNIDIEKVKAFSEEEIFRNKMTPDEQQAFLAEARAKLRREAKESGILQTAEDRAVRVLQQIYKPVGYRVNVAFK